MTSFRPWQLLEGDCLEMLRTLPDESIDSVVTDPPAGIAFMGKEWDKDKGGRVQWVAWLTEVMRECLRVLKPGGHMLVWALPRTSHWTAMAVEDSGFELRDCLCHVFGTGFPKSHSVLKPASEHWWLARKPLGSTVAACTQAHGTGALNIDGCRVGTSKEVPASVSRSGDRVYSGHLRNETGLGSGHNQNIGRWPPNLLLSHDHTEDQSCEAECPVEILDGQAGPLKSGSGAKDIGDHGDMFKGIRPNPSVLWQGDSGGASRFFPVFYCPKASKSDRGEGNAHPTVKSTKLMAWLCRLVTPPGGLVLDPFTGSGSTGVAALAEGFRFIGIEREAEYLAIAKGRLETSETKTQLELPVGSGEETT